MAIADEIGIVTDTLAAIAFIHQAGRYGGPSIPLTFNIYILFTIEVTLQLNYNTLIGAWPIIIAN